ncbi:MAG: Rrf2 family transcriptional regulator [Candidatus Omnitrophica bacterium]|nr:Rrf2 family transcriptional regulator [Candidatus Omnitrophota bacterium]
MRLSAKIEYACKAVIELALHYQHHRPVQLNDISKRQYIPKQFLVQIMIRLKNSGLVNSVRGIAGGYLLLKAPSQISLADVFRAVDDNILAVKGNVKSSKAQTLINSIWNDLNSQLIQKLEGLTFDTLVAKIKNESVTYYI